MQKKEHQKKINERIEDLVESLEKTQRVQERIYSFRYVLLRGIFQGLGIIFGSTIFAGILYYFFVTYLGLDFY